jgi:hypothetical protein
MNKCLARFAFGSTKLSSASFDDPATDLDAEAEAGEQGTTGPAGANPGKFLTSSEFVCFRDISIGLA